VQAMVCSAMTGFLRAPARILARCFNRFGLANDRPRAEGNLIAIEGDSGKLYLGCCETAVTRPETELAEIASWRLDADDQHHRGPKISYRV
jgi:hypothetical protein